MSSEHIDAYWQAKGKSNEVQDVSVHNTFERFCKTINKHREICELSELELDNIMCHFL